MKIEIKKPTEEELKKLGVKDWGIWTKEVSEFDWYYDDKETCYVLEGEVEVETDDGTVEFSKGDLVTFPKGLECVWKVKKPIKKHFKFG